VTNRRRLPDRIAPQILDSSKIVVEAAKQVQITDAGTQCHHRGRVPAKLAEASRSSPKRSRRFLRRPQRRPTRSGRIFPTCSAPPRSPLRRSKGSVGQLSRSRRSPLGGRRRRGTGCRHPRDCAQCSPLAPTRRSPRRSLRSATWRRRQARTSTGSSPQFGPPENPFGPTRPQDIADKQHARGCNQELIRQLADARAARQQRYG
jgi:hypothetical protein